MRKDASCKKYRNMIMEYVDGCLADTRIAGLLSHLKTCSSCNLFLNESKSLKHALSSLRALPATTPDKDFRRTWVARVANERASTSIRVPARPLSVWARFNRRGFAAACVAVFAFVFVLASVAHNFTDGTRLTNPIAIYTEHTASTQQTTFAAQARTAAGSMDSNMDTGAGGPDVWPETTVLDNFTPDTESLVINPLSFPSTPSPRNETLSRDNYNALDLDLEDDYNRPIQDQSTFPSMSGNLTIQTMDFDIFNDFIADIINYFAADLQSTSISINHRNTRDLQMHINISPEDFQIAMQEIATFGNVIAYSTSRASWLDFDGISQIWINLAEISLTNNLDETTYGDKTGIWVRIGDAFVGSIHSTAVFFQDTIVFLAAAALPAAVAIVALLLGYIAYKKFRGK